MRARFLFIFIIVILPFHFSWAYPWPISPFNTQHPITATLGEYRPPYGSLEKHFHWGVDIGESAGTNVYPVTNGKVKRWNNKEDGFIIVGDFRYVHINPNDDILDTSKNCTASVTLLGKIGNITIPHLHFAEGMGGISNRVNPLRVGGLTPYTDSAMPAVYGGNNYRFYRKGGNVIITSPLYGKVDILTKAKDAQSNGSDIVGIYRIGYQVNDEEGNTILPYIENIKFDNVNGKLNAVYGSESDISNYYYWVTNALSTNNCYRYWNTKLKSGQNWNGANAAINSQVGCPDGKYKVWVLAYDIRGNGGNMATHKGAESKDINIDNFVPYASCVEVDRKRGWRNKVYTGEWILDASGTKLELEIEKETALPGETLSVYIDFSEAMNKNNIDVKLSLNEGEDKIDVDPIAWTSKKIWTGEVIIPTDSSSLGEAIIEITCKDLTGNSLDNNPKTIGGRERKEWI